MNSSLFVCLFCTRYNSQILKAFYTQFIISYKFMAIALSVNTQNNHGIKNRSRSCELSRDLKSCVTFVSYLLTTLALRGKYCWCWGTPGLVSQFVLWDLKSQCGSKDRTQEKQVWKHLNFKSIRAIAAQFFGCKNQFWLCCFLLYEEKCRTHICTLEWIHSSECIQ